LPSRLLKALLPAFILLLACDHGPDVNEFNYEPEVNLFALLLLNSQQTIIRLEETSRSMDPLPDDRGIAGAELSIQGGEQRVAYRHQGGGIYAEEGEKLRLIPGVTYKLLALLPDGRRVEAECTMPVPPDIIAPAEQERVEAYASLPISWRGEQGTPGYIVSVRGITSGHNAETKTDSTAVDFFPFYLAQPDRYVLKVAAVDRNYNEYLRVQEDEVPIWRVRGGIGVFGAMAWDEHVIIAQ